MVAVSPRPGEDALDAVLVGVCVAITVPGIRERVAEGQTTTVDLDANVLTVDGEQIAFAPLPPFVLEILDAGGLIDRLVSDGHLPTEAAGV